MKTCVFKRLLYGCLLCCNTYPQIVVVSLPPGRTSTDKISTIVYLLNKKYITNQVRSKIDTQRISGISKQPQSRINDGRNLMCTEGRSGGSTEDSRNGTFSLPLDQTSSLTKFSTIIYSSNKKYFKTRGCTDGLAWFSRFSFCRKSKLSATKNITIQKSRGFPYTGPIFSQFWCFFIVLQSPSAQPFLEVNISTLVNTLEVYMIPDKIIFHR